MRRNAVRVLMNIGDAPLSMKLLPGEALKLASSDQITMAAKQVQLPRMSLAILQVQ